MGAMFTYCSKLTQLDFTLFDTRNVTDTRWMFEHCEKLTTIYISNKWSMDRVTNAMDMFKECYSLPGFSPEKTGIDHENVVFVFESPALTEILELCALGTLYIANCCALVSFLVHISTFVPTVLLPDLTSSTLSEFFGLI